MATASALTNLKMRTFCEPVDEASISRIICSIMPIDSFGAEMITVLVRRSGVNVIDSRMAALTSISVIGSPVSSSIWSAATSRRYLSTVAC